MLQAGFRSTTMLLGLSALATARRNYHSHWPDRFPDKEQPAGHKIAARHFPPPYLDPRSKDIAPGCSFCFPFNLDEPDQMAVVSAGVEDR
jgi:hypothetical protein